MKQAFTLVELLVVITIIALISTMSINSFLHFTEQQALQSQLQLFESDIKSLDRKVKNKEIFDYEVQLFENTGYYIVKKNTSRKANNLKLERNTGKVSFENTDSTFGNTYTLFELDTNNEILQSHISRFSKTGDNSNFTITDSKYNTNYIFGNGNYTRNQRGTYTSRKLQQKHEVLVKIYKNNKLTSSDFVTGDINIQDFSITDNYEIQATLFTETEIIPLEAISLKQLSKTDKEILYMGNNVTIKNIFGNKEVTPNTVNELTFEQVGKQATIKIP